MSNEINHGLLFPARPSLGRNVLWIASIALSYFVAARLSLLLQFQPEGIAALWPPTGIFLSAILLTRRDLRPWLAGTLCITDFMAERLAGAPFLVSAVYALALTGDAVLSAWLLHRFVGATITFGRVREVAGWLALSVLLSNALMSLAAAAASQLLPEANSFSSSWQWWAASNGVGNLLVTPFILTWAAWGQTRLRVWRREKAFEWAALFIPLALLTFALFNHLYAHKLFALFLPYVVLPFLLWAALRFGVRGVATALIILAAISIPCVASGRVSGFSYASGVLDDVIVVQLFLAIMAVPALFLAAVVAERHQAEAARLAGAQRHAVTLKSIGDAVIATDIRGRVELVNPVAETLTGWRQEEARGKRLEEIFRIINEDTRQAVENPVSQVLREGAVVGLANHTVLVAKDGAERPIADSGAPIRDEQNEILGVVLVFRDQTQERAAQKALRESEMQLQLAIEAARMGTWDWNIRTGRVVWSPGHEALWGYAPGSFPGTYEGYESRLHPDDVEGARRAGQKALDEHSNYEHEYRVRWPDGTVRWIASRGQAFYGLDDKPARMIGMAMDITEQKQAAESLHESAERLRLAQSAAHVGIWDYDLKTQRAVWTAEQEALFGFAPGTYDGAAAPFEQLINPDDRPRLAQAIARAMETGAFDVEFRATRRDGELRWFAGHGQLYRDAAGRPARMIGINLDITERQQAEVELQRSEERYRLIFTLNPMPMWIYDWDTLRFLEVNEAAVNHYGYTAEEFRAMTIRDIRPPEDVAALDGWVPHIPRGLASSGEWRHRKKDGTAIRVSIHSHDIDLRGQNARLVLAEDITERKQAEAALRESQAVYYSLVEQLPAGVFRKDLEGRFVLVNPWFCRLKGMKAEEFLGKTSDEVAAGEQAKPDARELEIKYATEGGEHHRQIMETGRPLEMLEEYANAQGQNQFLHIIKTPLLNPDGKIIGTQGILVDLTEVKRAEALKETLLSLTTRLSVASTAANVARSVFAVADRLWQWECGVLDVCSPDGGETETVLCVDVVEGERRELLPPGTRNKCSPRERRILMHGAELMLRTPEEMKASDSMMFGNTARLSASLMCVPIRQRGEPVGVLSIQSYRRNAFTPTDLETLQGLADHCGGALERIRAEAQLREQAALLDAATDAIYVRTLDHTVTYWNAGAERLYGWPRAEALGRKITDLGDADHAAFEAAHATLLAQGSWSGELRKTSKSGNEEVVFCRWTLLRDEQGRPREVLAINTDITGQKQMEANFLRAQRMEGIGALAGGIAHDLNNILAPILMIGPLLRQTVSDPESRQMINTVENCAQRGADIIKQLLTFARGKPGARAPLPVRHLLNEMHKLICETFPRNIQSRVNVPKDLWLILGDATQIHQALMNLCVNARDALPEGGTLALAAENVTLDKTAAALAPEAKPGEYVRVSVADTGTGISPQHLDRIFDPFFTTKEIGKGTGLGLATVLGIVRGHGGFVRVNSRVGQGTTFELYLPASPEATATGTPAAEALPPRGQGELILVVDDEASVREITQQTLEKYGYRVIAAGEGAEALALLGQHPETKAVITDMMMPGMDGPKLVRALRQLDARLPILGMTGLAGRAGVKGMEALNLPAVLNKPFAAVALLTALHEALARPV
jgi:PAS domain S-box-containing protein